MAAAFAAAPQRTLLRGFADPAMEARFHAHFLASGEPQYLPMAIVITCAFSYVLLCDAFPSPPSWARAGANIGVGVVWLAFALTTAALAHTRAWLAVRAIGFGALTLGFPLLAQRASTACFTAMVLTLSPTPGVRALPQAVFKGARVLLITGLQAAGYYAAELPRPAPWPGSVGQTDNSLLYWVWAAWLVAASSVLAIERVVAARFAAGEALARAREAGAAALDALLPAEVAAQLAAGTAAEALTSETHGAAVLVADVAGFTALAAQLGDPARVFALLNAAIRDFEAVAHAEGAFKVKTVGDCIVLAAGLRDFPGPVAGRGANVALLARVARAMHRAAAHQGLRLRAGVHVGPLVTGVLAAHGFTYDAWGEGVARATAAAVAAPAGRTAFTAEAWGAMGGGAEGEALLPGEAGAGGLVLTAEEPAPPSRKGSDRLLPPPPSPAAAASAAEAADAPPAPPLRATWAFDVLGVGGGAEGLAEEAANLLTPLLARCAAKGCAIPPAAALTAARALLASYGAHAFHNAAHALAVMQTLTLFFRVPAFAALLPPQEAVLLALAALGHDAGHGGVNNAFEVATGSPLAARYGGSGPVLERHHAAATAEALLAAGVFAGMEPQRAGDLTHLVNAAIMATDMARHDSIVEDLERAGAAPGGWAALSPLARAGALLHAADLGAQAYVRGVAEAWSGRICAEFAAQAEREARAGVPVTPFMVGLGEPAARARVQARFVGGVVAPLWRALAALAGGALEEPLRNVEAAAARYAEEAGRGAGEK